MTNDAPDLTDAIEATTVLAADIAGVNRLVSRLGECHADDADLIELAEINLCFAETMINTEQPGLALGYAQQAREQLHDLSASPTWRSAHMGAA
jgi:hypothetical protein